MPGIEFSKTGGDCGIIQRPQAAAHPLRSPLFSSLLSLRTAAQGPQRLGLCDNQVSGDLKSGNEGTQLNLLVGANRKSVPKRNQTKGKKNRECQTATLDKTTKEIKEGKSAERG